MPWNMPGNNQENPDPWGGKKKPSPPDLDKLIGEFFKKTRTIFQKPMKGTPQWKAPVAPQHFGYGVGIALLLLLVVWFLAGIYVVNPAEQAVILRFGKFSSVEAPGLHWMARFIDTKYLVDVQKIYTFSIQGDYLTKSSEQNDLPNQIEAQKKDRESLDQSKNLVNVELNVQYRVNNPRAYLFNIVNADDSIQEVASGALSDVIGQMKLDEVLTTGRESLSLGVMDRLKQILKGYTAGLDVVAVTLKKVQAPDQVREAFNDVNRAEQDKSTYIQQAQAYASKIIPLAQGIAARTLADATAYRQQVVLSAQAQVARYQALLTAFQASPEITRQRIYLETMQSIFENTNKVLLDTNTANNLIYLPLDKLMKPTEMASAGTMPMINAGGKNDTN